MCTQIGHVLMEHTKPCCTIKYVQSLLLQFWDDRTPHAVRHIYGPHICGDALDIDAVHNHVITGSWRKNNVLQIWDITSGSKIKDVPQDALHKCMVRL